MKKCLCLILCLCIVCCFFQIPVMAAEEPELNTMQVSSEAGSHGVYCYDAETGEETFVPAEEYGNENSSSVPASLDLQEEVPEITPRHVIGSDSRTKVSNPTGRYQSTCLLGSRFNYTEDGVTPGTGWLLNQNYVMTAGHMVYNYDDHYADHIAVYIGSSGGTFKQYRLGYYYTAGGDYIDNPAECESYYNKGMFDDWGIVKLDAPVTVSMSYLGRHTANSASDMQGQYYYTQGYPQDLNEAVYGANCKHWNLWDMYTTGGYITTDRIRLLGLVQTEIDIDHGQSGSPVYRYISGSGYCAEGIVVGMSYPYDPPERNFIILLNNWLMNYINNNLT